MSVWKGMAHDGGYRGDEAKQVARMLEEEERERVLGPQCEPALPSRYCRCTSIIGLADPHCQIHGHQQRQDSLTDQMRSVVRWANEHGCYDAADWIEARWEDK